MFLLLDYNFLFRILSKVNFLILMTQVVNILEINNLDIFLLISNLINC